MNFKTFSNQTSRQTGAALIGAFFVLNGAPAQAQQSEIDVLRQQLVQLQARLDKLEAAKSSAPASPTVASSSKLPVVISGLLQAQGNAFFEQKGAAKAADTFRIRRSEIKITAPSITSKVSGAVMFDLAKTNNTTAAGSVLQELQLTYKIDESKTAPKFFDIGQYKPGFGYESDLVSSSALQMVERSQIYSFRDLAAASAPTVTLTGTIPNPVDPTLPPIPVTVTGPSGVAAARSGGGMGDSRDQGARLRGSFADGTILYNVGIFNGIGERQNGTAGGDPKAIVGRLIFKPKDQPFQLGVSALQANTRGDSSTGPLDRDGYNGFVVYKKDKLSFQAEYAELNSKRKNATATFRDGKGYYAGLGYFVSPKLELTGRYDSFDVKTGAGTGTSVESALGANYYIKKNNARIQANIVKVDGETGALAASDSVQLRTQFQVAF